MKLFTRFLHLTKPSLSTRFTIFLLLVSGWLVMIYKYVPIDHWTKKDLSLPIAQLLSQLPLSTSRSMTSSSIPTSQPVCHDVLHNMPTGRWHQKKMTAEEVDIMRRFYFRVRVEEHHIPKEFQRSDKKCGKVTIGPGLHFRALCHPEGQTPCCYDNVCVSKSMTDCTCDNCLDMRTPIHAEYATWRPVDLSCKPRKWSSEEMCRLLGNSTIFFMGDSLIRHLYTAFLLNVRGNAKSGALRKNIPKDFWSRCSGIYMFSEKACRNLVDDNVTACQGTVQLKHVPVYLFSHAKKIQNVISQYQNQPRSFIFFGMGLHDGLQSGLIRNVTQPILDRMRSRQLRWPRLLWAGVHQFGLMKMPQNINQQVLTYNRDMKRLFDEYQVPVFDTYNLTDNVMSFDGTHYGYGLNSMKVTILLHYLNELHVHNRW